MVKAVSFFKRKKGMSVEDFQSYWRAHHPAAVTRMPGIKRYVQSHTLLGGYRKGEPVADGIAEVWFEDTAAMRALAGTPVHAALREDEARFIDHASMSLVITDEHVIKDGPAPPGGVKNVEFVHRKPGMDVDAFQRYWRGTHAPIAARIATIRRYVQSHARRAAYEGGRAPACDGFAITWWDDVDGMRASAASPEYAATRADEPNFLDTARLTFIITREHVIVP